MLKTSLGIGGTRLRISALCSMDTAAFNEAECYDFGFEASKRPREDGVDGVDGVEEADGADEVGPVSKRPRPDGVDEVGHVESHTKPLDIGLDIIPVSDIPRHFIFSAPGSFCLTELGEKLCQEVNSMALQPVETIFAPSAVPSPGSNRKIWDLLLQERQFQGITEDSPLWFNFCNAVFSACCLKDERGLFQGIGVGNMRNLSEKTITTLSIDLNILFDKDFYADNIARLEKLRGDYQRNTSLQDPHFVVVKMDARGPRNAALFPVLIGSKWAMPMRNYYPTGATFRNQQCATFILRMITANREVIPTPTSKKIDGGQWAVLARHIVGGDSRAQQ